MVKLGLGAGGGGGRGKKENNKYLIFCKYNKAYKIP